MERESRKAPDLPELSAEYQPPAVSWEEPFEPVAASDPLGCGEGVPPDQCQ